MKFDIRVLQSILFFVLVSALVTPAQQPQTPKRPVPTLTNEDVQPITVPAKDVSKSAPDADKAGDEKKGQGKEPAKESAKESAEEKKQDPAEQEWKRKLAELQDKLRKLERQTDQAELQVVYLRNNNSSSQSQSADQLNEANVRMAEWTQQARNFRQQAKAVQAEIESLKQEGTQKNYQDASTSSQATEGAAESENSEAMMTELQQEISDAETRQQVIQTRINQLTLRIRQTAGSGDNFAIRRLKDELEQEQNNLKESVTKADNARKKISELRLKPAAQSPVTDKTQP